MGYQDHHEIHPAYSVNTLGHADLDFAGYPILLGRVDHEQIYAVYPHFSGKGSDRPPGNH